MRMQIDLNCDLGEGCGNDHLIMPFISSANISCGFHAGDESSIRTAIQLAKDHGVAIGIHPSYPDKQHFGRTELNITGQALADLITEQIQLFIEIAASYGVQPSHVKPHGALYNTSAKNDAVAQVIAETIMNIDPQLKLYGLANSRSAVAAAQCGLPFVHEVFADRTYTEAGLLTPRSAPNAMIEDTPSSLQQILQMIQDGTVTSTKGTIIPIQADTICIHGDGPHAVGFAEAIHQHLLTFGITIAAP